MSKDNDFKGGDPFGDGPPRRSGGGGSPLPFSWPLIGGVALLALLIVVPFFLWVFCRIEPSSGHFAVLIHKTGKALEPQEIIAADNASQGIQIELLPEGRYFRNPYAWAWEIHPVTDIPAGKLGVLTRLYGKDLPPGEIIAREGTKGIVAEVLRPGKHRINPYAYDVEFFDATRIRPGFGGVATALVGKDLFDTEIAPSERNAFLAPEGFKGVRPTIYEPGTYYLNPYIVSVAEVNLQSQRFEMSGDDAITFLTVDGFTVYVEGTIEYALIPKKVAQLTHQVGDMDDIIKKIIMPLARGFSRIEGSKNPAKNYITGQTRQQFQNNLETHLKAQCLESGVAIRSVLIRNIKPPDQIASIIREREVAVQDARKIEQQIAQAKSQAELTRQEALAQQNKEKVESETVRIRAVISAQQDREVKLIHARQRQEVARLEVETAKAQAEAMLLSAEAQRTVIAEANDAAAGVFAAEVAAFGSGLNFARYELNRRIGPQIGSILTSDDEAGLGGLFRPFVPSR